MPNNQLAEQDINQGTLGRNLFYHHNDNILGRIIPPYAAAYKSDTETTSTYIYQQSYVLSGSVKNDMKGSYILKCNHCQLYKGEISYNSNSIMIVKTIGLAKKQNIQGKEKHITLSHDHIDVLFYVIKILKAWIPHYQW